MVQFACGRTNKVEPGIVLSFDDDYLDNWVGILPLLERYDAKVTFFISGLSQMDSLDLEKVKLIRAKGHEIGAHTENHLSLNQYIKNYGLKAYWEKEIKAQLSAFDQLGIYPIVFAYPYGEKNQYIDFLLLSRFKATRNVVAPTKGVHLPDKIFHNLGTRQNRFYSLAIDNRDQVQENQLLSAFQKVAREQKVIFLHAHDIGEEEGYEINVFHLERMLRLAKSEGLKMHTFSALLAKHD
ncbi:polysaccharide deacetylase family protein [Algoriphagus hitonicola]|uniref:Polysaccharide deacetylase n=1 Tax=Algoriphagus hitonicola TaxID=435880 RepID=A0A1I2TFY1_9BACT|nr:polysaccharide deacetylase family protein [Algoriphagus hitonicola]SFG63763.1 Polysaccharide deacetylase [Algoriphagus hitonicola]